MRGTLKRYMMEQLDMEEKLDISIGSVSRRGSMMSRRGSNASKINVEGLRPSNTQRDLTPQMKKRKMFKTDLEIKTPKIEERKLPKEKTKDSFFEKEDW